MSCQARKLLPTALSPISWFTMSCESPKTTIRSAVEPEISAAALTPAMSPRYSSTLLEAPSAEKAKPKVTTRQSGKE